MLEQLQAVYVKADDSDKIIATGEKLLALDPDDPEAAAAESEGLGGQEGPARYQEMGRR